MELWEQLLIVGAAAALVARVMAVWPGLPPRSCWNLRAKVLVWLIYAIVTAFFSAFIYVVWSLREEAAT